MTRVRPFRAGDEPALADICLRTADAGGDATGVLDDDAIWAEVFLLPYLARHPDTAFVVETDDARVAGYIVCAPDTRTFEAWFRDEWWPRRGSRWPRPIPRPDGAQTRQDAILTYAYGRGGAPEADLDRFPAHLHIDLLPELQGQGWGSRLIETLVSELRSRGIPGLHLGADLDNTGALAFYDRLGFDRQPSHEGVQMFARDLGNPTS